MPSRPPSESLRRRIEEQGPSWMRRALELGQRAGEEGEIPVGALVLDSRGRELSSGWNRTLALQDPSAHAELLALRRAAALKGNARLEQCILVTTLEPCLMCLGALLESRVAAVVSGADDPERGALELAPARGYRGLLLRGVEAEACAELLRRSFARLRADDR